MICGSSLSRNGNPSWGTFGLMETRRGTAQVASCVLVPVGFAGLLPWGRGPLQEGLTFFRLGKVVTDGLDLRMIQVDTVGLYLPQTKKEVDSGAWLEIGVGLKWNAKTIVLTSFRLYVICDSYLSTLLVSLLELLRPAVWVCQGCYFIR